MIETTTSADGSITRNETKPDGSSVTEITDVSGSTGTVRTDENGQTKAKANLSEEAIEDAKQSGEAVKVPAPVTAGKTSDSAPTVDIKLPGGAGKSAGGAAATADSVAALKDILQKEGLL